MNEDVKKVLEGMKADLDAFAEEVGKVVERMKKEAEEAMKEEREAAAADAEAAGEEKAAEDVPAEEAEVRDETCSTEENEAPKETASSEESAEGESAEDETAEDESGEDKPFFIHKTGKGFEVDTQELGANLKDFGEKVASAFSGAMASAEKAINEGLQQAEQKMKDRQKADRLAKMLPYMGAEEVHEIVEKIIAGDEEMKDVKAETLLPFMSREDCGRIFERSLAANDLNPGADNELYLACVPYVDGELLSKLVDRYVEGQYPNVKMDKVYPYLKAQDVKRIFYYELKKE